MTKEWNKIKPEKQRLVTVKGTSGSGKTTITFKLISQYTHRTSLFIPGRRQPIGYIFEKEGKRPLGVIGHYAEGSAGCGGLDSIPTYASMLEMAKLFWDRGYHVYLEGLLASGDSKQTIKLNTMTGGQTRVLALTTTMDQCIDAVNIRRRSKNPDASDVDPANLLSKAKAIPTVMENLEKAGVQAKWVDRNEGWIWVAKILGHDAEGGWTIDKPDPEWKEKGEERINLQSLDSKGERVHGIIYDPTANGMKFDQATYDREMKMAAVRAQKKEDKKLGGPGNAAGSKTKASSYASMIRPDDNADPKFLAFYRRWRQQRRSERKARKANTALGKQWPPAQGEYSEEWHAQEREKWQLQYAAFMQAENERQGTSADPITPAQEPTVIRTTVPAQGPLLPGMGCGAGQGWHAQYLTVLEQEVQFLSQALTQALGRLEAARKIG